MTQFTNEQEQQSAQVKAGDFVSFGQTFGQVQDVIITGDTSRRLMIQEHPDQPTADWKYYDLSIGKFTVE